MKRNYQKEMEGVLEKFREEKKDALPAAPQLLRPLQQLRAGISVPVFPDHGFLL